MNLCKQTLLKLNLTHTNLYTTATRCCTVNVTANPIKEDEGELDKLYKSVELELRGNDAAVLRSYAKFTTTAAGHFDIESQNWAERKPLHDRLTLLKSAHVHKKHRVQYEFRTYFHFIKFKYLTESTADTLLEYVQRNLPEGVALKTTKVEIQKLPEHFVPPTDTKMIEDVK